MNKRIHISVVLILAHVVCMSQNYLPLPGAGAFWQYVEYNTGSLNPPFWNYYYLNVPDVDSDTTVSNLTYHKLVKTDDLQTAYYGCFRSESNGKTWFIHAQDSTEQLVMDLDVQPGDTLFDIYIINRFQNPNPQYVVIDSISVFQSGATPLKMVFASYETGFLYQEPLLWIESLGAMQGFANQVHDGWSRWIPLCISFNDSVRYSQQCNLCVFDSTFLQPRSFMPVFGDCQGTSVVITGIGDLQEPLQLNIYPNPTTHTFTLEPATNTPSTLRIYTLTGRLLRTQRTQGRTEIDVSDLPEGIYLLELETPEGVARQKLVLQR